MERRRVTISGVVQGVGFRPYLFQLATTFHLAGFTKNVAGDVVLELEGPSSQIQSLLDQLQRHPPCGATLQVLKTETLPTQGQSGFTIERSQESEPGRQTLAWLAPDRALCGDCRQELADPTSRRFWYPLTSCQTCGPRLTIARQPPYERSRTALASYPFCRDCSHEYHDASDRRFHAETTCCSQCGPPLELIRPATAPVAMASDANQSPSPASSHQPPLTSLQLNPAAAMMKAVSDMLRAGGVVAIKGVGGYHLACSALNSSAVQRLRLLKQRDARPLALMMRDLQVVEQWCELSDGERHWLASPTAPIVLLRRRRVPSIEVAGDHPLLGVMLPYSPLHHLLMQQLGELPLVMTSANVAGEPMLIHDDDACDQLLPLVDAMLLHRRPIEVRCDDSVVRQLFDGPLIIRRSRGFVPLPLQLPTPCPTQLLAVGAEAKSVFALGLGRQAILSHHVGDLDHWATTRAFEQEIAHYERLFSFQPLAIAHDLHLDYASTKYAERRAEREQLQLIPVQHHHAHLASCLADNESSGPAIGLILDGTGWGLDLIHGRRAVWGGELLVGDASGFHRAAHLRYVALPGGERAIREPWRMTVSHLLDTALDPELFLPAIPTASIRELSNIIARPTLHSATSSAGRLFDAVSGLLGWTRPVSYEGQAAEWLESLALNHSTTQPCSLAPLPPPLTPLPLTPPPLTCSPRTQQITAAPREIDTRPLLHAICDALRRGTPTSEIAWFFHDALAALLADSCAPLRDSYRVQRVALSGGVFLNALFTERVTAHLKQRGWEVLRHRRVPPSDAGLSLGQLAVAAATIPATMSPRG